MSLVQNKIIVKNIISRSVSIHYMSLVQINEEIEKLNLLVFQYIICRWFNSYFGSWCIVVLKFQYIICRWFNF